jgi:hypothetical protein
VHTSNTCLIEYNSIWLYLNTSTGADPEIFQGVSNLRNYLHLLKTTFLHSQLSKMNMCRRLANTAMHSQAKIDISISNFNQVLPCWYRSNQCKRWVWLFACLFWVARASLQLSGDCHQYRWQGCKYRPTCMLSTYGFLQWGLSYVPHLLWHGTSILRSYPTDPWFSLLNAVHLAKEQSLPILYVLGLTKTARAGFKLTTSWMLSKTLSLGYRIQKFCKCGKSVLSNWWQFYLTIAFLSLL